ncbi:MAG: hypothetical protein R3E79_14315 [Caldilineaceae bacterium]
MSTKGKETAVSPIRAVNEFVIAGDESPGSQEEHPEISQGNGEHQLGKALGMAKPGRLEVKAVAFAIAIERFSRSAWDTRRGLHPAGQNQ